MTDRPASPAREIAVVPRAGRPGTDVALPVDQLVRAVLGDGWRSGVILITGKPGGGKTTAVAYLRATLGPATPVYDDHEFAEADRAARAGVVVLATPGSTTDPDAIDRFALRPWSTDDWLEYLLVRHRPACGSVLRRLAVDPSAALLGGSPQLAGRVLDAMAADPALTTARTALRQLAWAAFPPGPALDDLMAMSPTRPIEPDQWHWWRHAGVRDVCTADWVAAQLAGGETPRQLGDIQVFGGRVAEIAAACQLRPAAAAHLRHLVAAGPKAPTTPMVASVLLAVEPLWRPPAGANLARAVLAGAAWAGVDLSGAVLTAATLTNADLTGADLAGVLGREADLTGSRLRGAKLTAGRLEQATLRDADLSTASAAYVVLDDACLAGADLTGIVATKAMLAGTDLTDARAVGGDFGGATFAANDWADADFTDARFIGATFNRCDLTTAASWAGARFADATFDRCNFEGIDLPGADFAGADLTGSLLTGSRLPRADLRRARLCETGLADVDWTDADLRGADFTKASFHLGSTRAGLVGSIVPMEGSMTGFYTDDYPDRGYRPPEEIRKACLCGADLTGAVVDDADWYLVDLRGATYTADQREHFVRTRAILD